GNGALDVATLAVAPPEARMYRGLGNGLLAPPATLETPVAPIALAAGPFTHDAADDLVLLERDAIALRRGGTAGPGPSERASLLGPATGMAVADLDRDGWLDVAVVVQRPGSGFHLGVYRVNGVDEFIFNVDVATDFTGAGRACAGDVTGDGADDLVVLTSQAGAPVLLLAGRGDVTFAAPAVAATAAPVGAGTVPVCADLDGDGRADLLLLEADGSGSIAILPSLGPTLGTPRLLDVHAVALATADLDRDGDVDLVLAPASGQRLLFLRNLGDGRFAAPVEWALGGTPAHVLVTDLDGDLWPDVVVSESEGTVAVLRNLGGV
ncbi:MAG TPA: VCBS repeat-containing protein, partial [Anaeromyxobacteraceae bacterium]|nr:VCBS repeat-containing protein [Anaeromyxobacteraceae bacterium]